MFATYSALESIDHQGLSPLAMDLEIAITKLRDLKRVGELDAANSGISKIIKKHTISI